jgi:hypothetical protein
VTKISSECPAAIYRALTAFRFAAEIIQGAERKKNKVRHGNLWDGENGNDVQWLSYGKELPLLRT